ncbi:hypothetical protein I5677_09570 [Mobilitalea sibirica]|uniref:Uncharacterized protein n=1 Tax=Mobilitalea sibirica TaxID=1462919 RepID=A0A8J7L2Q3_9FIRM|nr:DUF5696 domain-containing protein [Mobilitalea sibirica]MBH1941138.1 hypothetical protein [Mobilitalea sibirica]
MKNRKLLLLLMLIGLLLSVVSACSKEAVEEEIEIYSYDTLDEEEIVFENDELEFHFIPETTHFYVVKKSTGYTWYSNPQDADSDTIATGMSKKDLNATISIKYNTESGSATQMNNYASSIEKGNFTYEKLENGVKVNYTIADIEKSYIFPAAVPESRFNEFFEKMDKSTQSQVLMSYQVYDINKPRPSDNKEELLELYPDYANEPVYVLREGTQEYLKQRTEEFFAAAGYTQEDYEIDAARYNVTSSHDKPIFNISVIYELQEDGLVVSVPLNEVDYKETHPIVELRVLAYFGAGGLNDEGFILVPDGSGGIINFNNKKQSQSYYASDVYGWDYGMYRDAIIDETRANMPLFGISNKEASFLCVLEKGSSYAFIEADVSGRMNSYNNAAANYYMIRSALMDISAKSDKTVRMFQEELPDEVLSQRYIFIDGNDYPEMATVYRDYLMKNNSELVKKTETDLPVAVELIGAIDRTKHFIGIPTRQPYELTSYKEALEITKELVGIGITDLNVKYNGWFNEGVMHSAPNKVKFVDELGKKKDFNNLVTYANDNGVNLYLDSNFQFVYNNSTFDNFIAIRDAAKYVNRKITELKPFNPIWFGERDNWYTYHLAKPDYYLKNMDAYAKEISDLGVKNISFGDIGKDLGSDYNPKSLVSREETLNLQVQKLSELSGKGYNMMINSGNIYAVPYVDFIVDVNLATKGYNIIDEEVPFYEIALHGLVSYAGEPVNLAEDYEKNLLKTAETGAGLYFVFMGADAFELQDSRYTKYFSSEYALWSEKSAQLYKKMKKDFGHLYNQYITDHQKLAKGVYMTQYEDGTQVIVNYNESAYSHNGNEVPAKDYVVEGGKQ